MLRKTLFFIILWHQIIFAATSSLPQGNSAYLYGKNVEWVKQIQKYNQIAKSTQQFRYLFPLTGKMHVIPNTEKLSVTYDPTVTKFYKQLLPNILILANISYWTTHATFKSWSAQNYKIAADQIAKQIINDPNADGVHLDIEIYDPNMLPFYKEIASRLSAANKWVALFAGSKDISAPLLKALGNHGIIVLYGYDLHTKGQTIPVSPVIYAQRLKSAIQDTIQIINNSPCHFMIGVPAVATIYEWEQKKFPVGNRIKIIQSGYKMDQYFQMALKTVQQIESTHYLGYAVWAFVQDKSHQKYWPLDISPTEWNIMLTIRQ